MNELAIKELSNSDPIRSRIFTNSGVQVMLDRDLAELYGVATKALNQAVKRNIERFPERYMFQLSKEDISNMRSQFVTGSGGEPLLRSQNVTLNMNAPNSNLRSQIVTSRWGGTRYLPHAFTEHGIIMLASVLNSPTAVEASVRITDTFVAMRKALHDRFLIIDKTTLIHVGASLNHLGKKCFAFSSLDKSNIPDILAKI